MVSHGETNIDLLRNKRHTLLKDCKVEEIAIPLKKGALSDVIADETTGTNSIPESSMDVDTAATEGEVARRIALKESAIEIDYASLPRDIKDIADAEALNKAMQQFHDTLARIAMEIESMAPNMKAVERCGHLRPHTHTCSPSGRLDDVKGRLKANADEYETSLQLTKTAGTEFEAVKQARCDAFFEAFSHIQGRIDDIYKASCADVPSLPLMAVPGTDEERLARGRIRVPEPGEQRGAAPARVCSRPTASQEPYLQGIKYTVTPPMKRFREMEQLSGGEKTVAALALLFAIHSFRPAPFFVLDEVDAALDNTNVHRVARYMDQWTQSDFQCIVISLKVRSLAQLTACVTRRAGLVLSPG